MFMYEYVGHGYGYICQNKDFNKRKNQENITVLKF